MEYQFEYWLMAMSVDFDEFDTNRECVFCESSSGNDGVSGRYGTIFTDWPS